MGISENYTTAIHFGNSTDLRNASTNSISVKASCFAAWMGILAVTGLVTNSLILRYFPRHYKSGYNSVSIFILAMAVTDLLTSVFACPYSVLFEFGFVTTESFCRGAQVVQYFLVIFSNLLLLCCCIERYLALCHPYRKLSSRSSKVLVVATAVTALVAATPAGIIYSVYTGKARYFKMHGDSCYPSDGTLTTVFGGFLLCLFALSALTMLILYGLMFYTIVYKRRRFVANNSDETTEKNSNGVTSKHSRVAKSLLVPIQQMGKPSSTSSINDAETKRNKNTIFTINVMPVKLGTGLKSTSSNSQSLVGNRSISGNSIEKPYQLQKEIAHSVKETPDDVTDRSRNVGNGHSSIRVNQTCKSTRKSKQKEKIDQLDQHWSLRSKKIDHDSTIEVTKGKIKPAEMQQCIKTKYGTKSECSDTVKNKTVQSIYEADLFHQKNTANDSAQLGTKTNCNKKVSQGNLRNSYKPKMKLRWIHSLRRLTHLQSRTKLVAMLFGTSIIYLVCWLPFWCQKFDVLDYNPFLHYFFIVNNVTNICLYLIFNRTFRTKLLRGCMGN